jgi:outer membrane lipoprotein SlyB
VNALIKIARLAEKEISRDDARREIERRGSPVKRGLKTYLGKAMLGGAIGSGVGSMTGDATVANLAGGVGQIAGLVHAYKTNSRAAHRGRNMSDDDLDRVYHRSGVTKKASLRDLSDSFTGKHTAGQDRPTKEDADRELRRRKNGFKSGVSDYFPKSFGGSIAGGLGGAIIGGQKGAIIGSGAGSLAGLAHGYKSRVLSKERTKHMSNADLGAHLHGRGH